MIKTLRLLLVSTSIFAQDTIKLNDVSVTASRFKMEAISGKVIYTDSIKKTYFAQETPTLFSNTPSITAQTISIPASVNTRLV